MIYEKQGNRVRVEMTKREFDRLGFLIGFAASCVHELGHTDEFAELIELVNQLNAGNPTWTRYEIADAVKILATTP